MKPEKGPLPLMAPRTFTLTLVLSGCGGLNILGSGSSTIRRSGFVKVGVA